MTRDELIAALERATGPDRGLDCRITALLFDPLVMTDPGNHKGEGVKREPLSTVIAGGFPVDKDLAAIVGSPHYTASIDAAMTLFRPPHKLASIVRGYAVDDPDECWYAVLLTGGGGVPQLRDDGRVEAIGATPAIALCIAALKARETDHE